MVSYHLVWPAAALVAVLCGLAVKCWAAHNRMKKEEKERAAKEKQQQAAKGEQQQAAKDLPADVP